jgi:hypothetical protein
MFFVLFVILVRIFELFFPLLSEVISRRGDASVLGVDVVVSFGNGNLIALGERRLKSIYKGR